MVCSNRLCGHVVRSWLGTAEMRREVLRVPRRMSTFCEGSYCFRVLNAVDKLYVGSGSL